MADDLIPTPDEPIAPFVEGRATEHDRQPIRRGPYTLRFGAAYAALAIVVGLAVGGFVVLSGRPAALPKADWSSWQPALKGSAGAREIAEHVSRFYRLQSGAQMVGVIAGPPSVQNVRVGYYALSNGGGVDDLSILPAEDSVSYQLCGLGARCAIREGPATPQRARLLHRQAVELALYSFRYIDEADSVVAFMPPRTGQNPTFALFFRRSEMADALERPLSATLPARGLLTPEQIDRAETLKIARLTADNLFQYSFQQAPDGQAVLVLNPV